MKTNYRTMPSQVLRPEDYCITQDNMADRHMMSIPDDIYRELAELMRIECEYSDKETVKLAVSAERGDEVYYIEASCWLIAGKSYEEWGVDYYLKHITTCWAECHTYDAVGDERPNDFDLKKLKNLLDF